MIPPEHLAALKIILQRLSDAPFGWALTGSLGMALQGMPVTVRDIDIQCDELGAYGIPDTLPEFVTQPTLLKESPLLRSHFGRLRINGVEVEVMGDLQSRASDGGWNPPIELPRIKRWVRLDGHYIPVLSLAYEAGAYARMGRPDKAARLTEWAAAHPEDRVEAITNYRAISPTLASGGQPLPGQIEALARDGFSAVINLAMPDSHHALSGEAGLVTAQGMEYLPVPVEWSRPALTDLETFFALLEARPGRRVFAHCVLNFRVSTFIYLYRTLRLGQPAADARADLEAIWSPEPTWAAFIRQAGGQI